MKGLFDLVAVWKSGRLKTHSGRSECRWLVPRQDRCLGVPDSMSPENRCGQSARMGTAQTTDEPLSMTTGCSLLPHGPLEEVGVLAHMLAKISVSRLCS